jgi:hypothetical protein
MHIFLLRAFPKTPSILKAKAGLKECHENEKIMAPK